MGVVKIHLSGLFIFALLSLTGCQLGGHRISTRTPHIPVFPEIVKDKNATTSNPYWNHFTVYNDEISIKLSNGSNYRTHNPMIIGALGTHYRFEKNYYLFMMTEGAGAQYDWFPGVSQKISLSLYGGFDVNHGAQVSYAREVGEFLNGKVTPYISLQRRTVNIYLLCRPNPETGTCAYNDYVGWNEVWFKQQVVNFVLGLQLGRFKLGEKGRTTVNFKGELGWNHVLSHEIDRERFPAEPEYYKDSLMIGIHAGFNLW